MEENKIDVYQIIGFLLLIAAIFWWFNVTIPDLEKSANVENQTNAQENQSEIIIEKEQAINQEKEKRLADKDQTIEIAKSQKFKILCLMFHPERKNISQRDIDKIVFSHLKIK